MDELTNLIVKELGERAINDLPDIFAHGCRFPLDDSMVEIVRSVCSKEMVKKKFNPIQKLVKKMEEVRKYCLRNYRTSLAARIPGHDLSNIWGIVSFGVDAECNQRSATSQAKYSTLYKAYCLSMAYLASDGDKKFMSSIPVEQLPYLVKSRNELEFVLEQNTQQIMTPEYVALLQIIKNSPTEAIVSCNPSGEYTVISVQDSGKGIRDKAGIPLPPERLGEIFREFSSHPRGGLGLQVVNELVHLQEGYIQVETTTEGNPTFSYDTKTEVAKEIPPKDKGTTFTLYVPRVT